MTRRGWRHALGTMKAKMEELNDWCPSDDFSHLTYEELDLYEAFLMTIDNGPDGNGKAGQFLRQIIQIADETGPPGRFIWWAERFTGGTHMNPEEARTWLEAYALNLDHPRPT